MSRTLSPAVSRPAAPIPDVLRMLVVIGDPAPLSGDAAVPTWVRSCGWDLHHHPGSGPLAATAAARLDARVLLLRPTAGRAAPARPRPRVVAALSGLPDDGPVVADAVTCAARAGGALTLVHAVPRSFGERSVGLEGALALGRRLLELAARQAVRREPAVVVDCVLSRVRPHEVVGEALDADLLVVGGGRPDRPGPGLVTHSALHHAACPVLVVPRVSGTDGPSGGAQELSR